MKALESVDTIESTDEEQEERQQQNMQRRQRRPLSQKVRILSAEEELQRAAEELLAPKAPVAKAADAQPTADDSVKLLPETVAAQPEDDARAKTAATAKACRVAPVVHRVTCASAASAAAVTVMSVTRCNPQCRWQAHSLRRKWRRAKSG